MSSFNTLAGDPASPWILHVPHASRRIPAAIRARIRLDDAELELELDAMTDAHTDLLAQRIVERVRGARPWRFVNHLSRLVVDPERFPDEREVMERVGMGAVYTRTSTGAPLREDDRELIATYFEPYSRALADLVDERLAATGRAVIVDVHSFPAAPLPYELHPEHARPVTCLGTDERHTPAWLLDAAREAFAPLGSVAVDAPFRGTYVPLRHYGGDDRVTSIMLELRRDAFPPALDRFASAAARVIEDRRSSGSASR